MTRERRPRWVYSTGTEPDARFSFANERTFLAWIRTSLALLAAGVAVDEIGLSFSPLLQRAVAILLVSSGLVCAAVSWLRWARAERALRREDPLPSFGIGGAVALAVLAVAVVLLVTIR